MGSARIGPEDVRWNESKALGAALGRHGWAVMTGGYGGLMAAAAQGAAEAGVPVIGLPMRGWEAIVPNPWSSELRWSDTYGERLTHLLSADVVVALPGGIGTLAESTVIWSALQTEPSAPGLVFYGSDWATLISTFGEHLVIGPEDLELAPVATDLADCIAKIEKSLTSRDRVPRPRG